jgi:uncharacterized membrane protein YfcA
LLFFFGVGGSIVNGPLMLHLGVHPLVPASSTAVMIISAAAMFLFSTVTVDYALFSFVLGTVSSVVGRFFVGYFVNNYSRYAYIHVDWVRCSRERRTTRRTEPLRHD